MLAERFENKVNALLLDKGAYEPFPTIEDRQAWEAIPADMRDTCVAEGEKYIDFEWPQLTAIRFLDFVRNGNRNRYENVQFQRRDALAALVIAECIEGNGRFLDDIINGIWLTCEESFWGIPAHNNGQGLPDVTNPTIDLFAGETAGLLAWTYYLLRERLDAVTPLICKRIEHEMKQRIIEPYDRHDDFWWMGFSEDRDMMNWTPWCNANCLTAILLIDDDDRRRARVTRKLLRSLDYFLKVYGDDGGCDEGTSYWGHAGASLFDCLEQLYMATDGRVSVYDEPKIQNIGRFIYRSHIDERYFINFADGSAVVNIASDLVYRYGKRINDEKLMQMGVRAHRTQGNMAAVTSGPLLRRLPAIFHYEELSSYPQKDAPYVRDTWLPSIEVMAARQTEGSKEGLYVAAKGGHNDENHNHNDVGQFIVYSDGAPIIVDIGVETYTAKTFSTDRYSIWTMQSAYHNVPTIDGIQQRHGRQYAARHVSYKSSDSDVRFSVDIAGAYPPETSLRAWEREWQFRRGNESQLIVQDDAHFDKVPGTIAMTMITAQLPIRRAAGQLEFHPDGASAVRLDYATHMEVTTKEIPITDARLQQAWPERLYCLTFTDRPTTSQIRYTWRFSPCP